MSVGFDYKPFNYTGKEICLFDFLIGYFMYSMVILRVVTCLGYATVVLGLLWFDKTETLGIFLGFTMMGMVGLFLVVVVKMDLISPRE